MFFNAYSAGKHAGYEGSECYLIGCCGMCSFACMEPITRASATTFASAIMKILLRYGFCHTVVLNKDSKFFGVCREAINLLKLNCHILLSANHNPMIVERVNWYLTKGLKIMCNKRDSVCVALEAILLLLYAWNSCPVPGTDISCSLMAVGHEFAFPIDFSTNKHWELTSSPSTVVTYSKELATRLSACRQVAELLVREQRSYHRELINARRPDPQIYSLGNIVFARRALNLLLLEFMSTSYNMHSPDHGVSLLSLQVHPTSLNTVTTLQKRRKSTHQIYPHVSLLTSQSP
jgi:hypothetical protein